MSSQESSEMAQTATSIKSEKTTPAKAPRTCDNCRKRKIKCVEDVDDPLHKPCEGCSKLSLDCTHEYVKKKPGRKNTFAASLKAGNDTPNGSSNGHSTSHHHSSPANHRPPPPGYSSHQPHSNSHGYHPYYSHPANNSTSHFSAPSPLRSSISSVPGSQQTLAAGFSEYADSPSFGALGAPYQTPKPVNSFAFSPGGVKAGENGLSWLDSIVMDPSGGWGQTGAGASLDSYLDGPGLATVFASDQAQLLSLESPEHSLVGPGSGSGSLAHLIHPSRREPQLEDVTSWANISHFISLFLQYLYPLLPLVHRPTFAENLATRRDLRDTDFRALLLSIVAYVISQLPTSRLVNEHFDVDSLKRLQRRCHRTGKALQRTYYGPTNLIQICTIIFDTFYLLSIGLGHTAAARLGQAIQLAFSMGMHSDAKTSQLGLDHIEVQLRRRVFWQLYASDKTRSIPGPPMLINDFQGVCSLPEPVDDEFITSQGMFPQPPSRTSILAGFVSLSRIFRILSECFFHHRCITSGLFTVGTEWAAAAEERLHGVLRDMPPVIQDPTISPSEAMRQVFALQRANILITAAIAKFALYDLKASLNVDEEELTREREGIAREIHSLLMNIPVEDLASNGESVRAKVFHIACALCLQAPANAADQELIRDWCNMFSAISFVQMPPPPPGTDVLDSRANSPGPDAGPAPASSHGTGSAATLPPSGAMPPVNAPTSRST